MPATPCVCAQTFFNSALWIQPVTSTINIVTCLQETAFFIVKHKFDIGNSYPFCVRSGVFSLLLLSCTSIHVASISVICLLFPLLTLFQSTHTLAYIVDNRFEFDYFVSTNTTISTIPYTFFVSIQCSLTRRAGCIMWQTNNNNKKMPLLLL